MSIHGPTIRTRSGLYFILAELKAWLARRPDGLGPSVCTVEGDEIHFLRPELNRYSITAIAHSLSNLCRFTGHTSEFYSVAQHCVIVSHVVPQEHALAGLLHEIEEPYLNDLSGPLKTLLPFYKWMARRFHAAALPRFGLAPVLPPCVKVADNIVLNTERRDLMPPISWSATWDNAQPLDQVIVPLPPIEARALFLERFRELSQ